MSMVAVSSNRLTSISVMQKQSTSNRSQPGLNRPRPPRQTSSQRKQTLPFPRSSSDSRTATPGSPDLHDMKLPDVSMIDDQSFVGDMTETVDDYAKGIVQAEADISRMGRGSIVDTTMDLSADMASMDDVYDAYGIDYGEGVGGRRRKISGERMKRISVSDMRIDAFDGIRGRRLTTRYGFASDRLDELDGYQGKGRSASRRESGIEQ